MPQLKRVVLAFDTLGELLDGKVAAMLKTHLRRAAADCIDRSTEVKSRTVTLSFEFSPMVDQDGYADRASCKISAKSKLPVHITTAIEFELNPEGFLFNVHDPENLDQHRMEQTPGFITDDDDGTEEYDVENDG